jgi:sucrose-6-phosphate hydrolase SacC (GH32 family)
MYNLANRSKPEQVLSDEDDGAGVRCSGAGPGGGILRSPSSPTANVSDPKVNWVSRGNFMSKVQSVMVFPDGS